MEKFLLLLMITSTLTTLTTEALKKLLDEAGKKYNSNILAAISALALSVLVGVGYVIIYKYPITPATWVYGVALLFLSFLCATLGFDKVYRTIREIVVKDVVE